VVEEVFHVLETHGAFAAHQSIRKVFAEVVAPEINLPTYGSPSTPGVELAEVIKNIPGI